ncbi:S1C family serine protease [Butyribacter sp.]|uniref:S1C family serine protease n=1 Tax=Butyribacter sp. TaxID=2822465 RepID=UPI002A97F538|nr:trypsin-like peptidase domain-containing protein [Butyribacter sp.]
MDENNNLNGTDKNQSQDGYTGEYGNSVEGDGNTLDSSIYSYSYKDGENNAQSTHSGDYYAGSQSENYASQNSQNYENEQKTNPYDNNANIGYNSTNSYNNQNGYSFNAGQEKKPDGKKKGSFGKKLLVCAACAVLFGVIAAVCFEGVCYISSNVLGINTPSVTTSEQIGTTTTSSNNNKVATGAAVSGTTDVSSIVEQTMPAVVAITCTSESTNYYSLFGNSQQQETQSSGTGFIIGQSKSELLIATNNHVIDGAKTISVQFIDDQVYEASVKGKDSSNDLAVVAVKLSKIKQTTKGKIKIADVGDSDSLKVGEMAIAIGNSLGYGQSVTVGYISAKNREITETSETDGSTNSIKAIQTDAAINPGNSGGPLINLKGEVVGINSAKIADSSVEGVGYAIPISQATPIIDELKDKEVLSTQKKDISEFQEEQLEVKQAVTIFQVVSMLQRYQKAGQPKKAVLKSEI